MSSPGTQLERTTLNEKIHQVVGQLLHELGSSQAAARVRSRAHLERDLGLGSLERVELLLRLEAALGLRLPDRVLVEADTVDDLVAASLRLTSLPPADTGPSLRVPPAYPATSPPLPARAELDINLANAETLTDVLQQRVRATPDQAHVCLYEEGGPDIGDPGSPTTLTYSDLFRRAARIAGAIQERGVLPGDRVALMLPTCADFFATFFGILLAGAVPVPIYPPFRADRLEEYARRQAAILQNAGVRLLVTFQQANLVARLLRPLVPSLTAVANVSELARHPVATDELLHLRGRSRDLAFLQYTSGSTGQPKGVMLTHASLLTNIRAIITALELRPDDAAVSWLPLYHDMGLIGTWLVPLYFGIPVYILSPLAFLSRPQRWLWAIHHHRATISAAPNFAYELCVRKVTEENCCGLDLSSLRLALNGAEPVSPDTLHRFADRFAPHGLRRETLTPVYGLAEATLAVAVPPLGRGPKIDPIVRETFQKEGRAVPASPDDPAAIRFVSAGRPLPGHEVRIVDDNGADAGERRQGHLWFRGPSNTQGYYRNSAATRAILREDGWMDSGDLAYRADGEIYLTGRVKDIIIKAGRNLYPHEIEQTVGNLKGVRKGCVVAFGVSEERTGSERLVVVAEVRAPANREQAERVSADITEKVSEVFGLPPDTVQLLPPGAIPKTSSGKLRRSDTKALFQAGRLGARRLPSWLQFLRVGLRGSPNAILRALNRTAEVVYGVYALSVYGILLALTWTVIFFLPSRRAAVAVTRFASGLCLTLAGYRIKVVGAEHLERARQDAQAGSPWVFVSNHTSYTDILVLLAALPLPYRFVAKLEVRNMPFIRTFVRKLGHFAFDRSDRQARLQQVDEIEESLRRGDPIFVFPEGTFTPASGLRPFQLGAFKAAVVTGRPICPVALHGARESLRDGTFLPRPGRITLTLCPPLLPKPHSGDDWAEMVRLRDAARAAIGEHCGEPLL